MSAKEQFFNSFDDFENKARERRERVAAIRQRLVRRAEDVVLLWEAKKYFLLPEALRAAQSVILPWWEEIQTRLPRITKRSYRRQIFGPSLYEFPYESLRHIDTDGSQEYSPYAYDDLARRLEANPDTPIDELAVFGAGRQWEANLFLVEDEEQLKLSFRPIPVPKPGGMGGGYFVQSLHRTVDTSTPDSILNSLVHPANVIDFAAAIESGEIWDKLTS